MAALNRFRRVTNGIPPRTWPKREGGDVGGKRWMLCLSMARGPVPGGPHQGGDLSAHRLLSYHQPKPMVSTVG
eukprot:4511697-Prymnesium_polylepis.1